MKVLLKKVFMGLVNSAQDPLESLKSAGIVKRGGSVLVPLLSF